MCAWKANFLKSGHIYTRNCLNRKSKSIVKFCMNVSLIFSYWVTHNEINIYPSDLFAEGLTFKGCAKRVVELIRVIFGALIHHTTYVDMYVCIHTLRLAHIIKYNRA